MSHSLEDILSELDSETILEVMSSPRIWAEHCLISPNTGKPFRANTVQRQILDSKSRFNVIRVHRRAGKSYSFVILALFYMVTYENLKVIVVGPQSTHVAQIFDTFREFIEANSWLKELVISDSKGRPQTIQLANRSQILGFTTGATTSGKGRSLRGRGAELLLIDEAHYLADGDWPAITPIMQGDTHRIFPPRTFMASTPTHGRGFYYEVCTNPHHKEVWNEIHMSVMENPDLTDAYRAECRATCPSELDWIREWMAEFPEIGEGVFPRSMVMEAQRPFSYSKMFASAIEQRKNPSVNPPVRTMGVDWDKYNKDGHGCNMVILEATDEGYRLIYREEIPQSQFTLTNAVNRVVELNEIFNPLWIYVDRGYGDTQIEQLQLEGKRNRGSGLDRKVVGISFNASVDSVLPGGGVTKRQFKQMMISVLRGWFERGQIEISREDVTLFRQLTEYHVVKESQSIIKFSENNDHIIACLGLAAMAMWQNVKNPYAPKPATKSYVLPIPEAVPRDLLNRQSFNPTFDSLFGSASTYSRQFTRRKQREILPPIPRRSF